MFIRAALQRERYQLPDEEASKVGSATPAPNPLYRPFV
jgi:hypothetical protein